MNIPGNKPLLSLSVASKITGIPSKTLNYFEQQKLTNPAKTPGNRRLYSQEDLKKLFTIKYFKNKGLNSTGIKLMLEVIEYVNKKGVDIKSVFFKDLNEQEMLKKQLQE